jgi:PLP dependent protein
MIEFSRRENLLNIQERITKAAERSGRMHEEITLLAVSKYFPIEDINEIYSLGMRHFGESRAQELRDKAPLLPKDISWHFIGPLQTNKIKYVVPNADLIHAVDSLKLAQAIDNYAGRHKIKPKILIEINTSAEEAKHGFGVEEAVDKILEISEMDDLDVQGLMTMAPHTDDKKDIRKSFAKLKNIQEQLQNDKAGLFKILSMGMSGDFEIAIEEGSTIVRVGTGIFGLRRRQ